MEEEQLSKRRFFAALERLDHLDDTEDDEEGSFERVAVLKPSGIPIPTAASVSLSPEPPALEIPARASSDPKPPPTDKLGLKEKTRVKNLRRTEQSRKVEPSTEPKVRSVQRGHTTGSMPDITSRGPIPKKRKPNKNIKVVPEDQQIFKHLVFFFFPNNDVSPSRRLRIQRAQEYGVQWAQERPDKVTHIIVDKGLSYRDLVTHLKLDNFPEKVSIVNELYPSDCIRFRSVLSPCYGRFQVEGTPVVTEKKTPVVPEEPEPASSNSLPLKQSKRAQEQDQGSTQRSHEDSSPVALPASTALISEPVQNIIRDEETRERDALDDLIDDTRAISHLPLDYFDSHDEGTDDADNESTASESDTLRKSPESSKVERTESWAKSFACMQKFDPDMRNNNPNSKTIEILQQMCDYYERTADHWRNFAYRKGINALRRQKEKIVTQKQARAIPGIGKRLAGKIEEIVLTNRLRQFDNTNYTAEDRILQEFLGVYGAGLSQASKWLAQGYRSLSDLLEKASLTTNQRIGVEHYHDFMQRIPRKEVEAHGAFVRKAVQSVDHDLQVIIAGSYRRGALDSGDIDILITKPNASIDQVRSLMKDTVIPKLFEDGFLQVGLATSRKHNHDGSKWHGASTLPGSPIWRRIDLLFVPGAEIGAALLYFTGNDIFNRSMRLLARKKGLCLNQRGLYENVLRGAQRAKVSPGRLLESRDEHRIFSLLGVPWRPPEHRIC
ncbi:DNA polymerase family X [Penicillium longicatenatum]|uniref:DNA polymerase family X n=1 Tax=Penicillium longicatenatum TaxID=1561947 RepID=UPI0025497F9B|nr:DNA polymerase family X [Penicillium longicatenatum]KAJ5635824.1 DNA polymerase family X [Penicillium longicatenatum]